LTGLTNGNLSSHLAKLGEARLVTIEKRIVGKTPNTLISLTDKGSDAIEHHWQLLEHLRKGTQKMDLSGES
jgi:DNA-binding transcriptional ArsR family regulator